ncbi:MAG: hypothetical protein ACTSR0_00510 [Candidatus Asgardarchaeia archaeon]
MVRNFVEIHCFDANEFYEENFKRINKVMETIGAKLLSRKLGRSIAVGGTWALSLISSYEVDEDPINIKKLMMGLEYAPKGNKLVRLADIDVFLLKKKRGIFGEKEYRKKIDKYEIFPSKSSEEVARMCRKYLYERLDEEAISYIESIERCLLKFVNE